MLEWYSTVPRCFEKFQAKRFSVAPSASPLGCQLSLAREPAFQLLAIFISITYNLLSFYLIHTFFLSFIFSIFLSFLFCLLIFATFYFLLIIKGALHLGVIQYRGGPQYRAIYCTGLNFCETEQDCTSLKFCFLTEHFITALFIFWHFIFWRAILDIYICAAILCAVW